jgi:hypothetical protein
MSLIYGIAVEGKVPKGSDSRDLQHALCTAAAADIFVTHDEELAFLLHRVPIKGFTCWGCTNSWRKLPDSDASKIWVMMGAWLSFDWPLIE